jgi:hypothetical protein
MSMASATTDRIDSVKYALTIPVDTAGFSPASMAAVVSLRAAFIR